MFLSVDLNKFMIDGITRELKSAADSLEPIINIGFNALEPAPPNCKHWMSSGNSLN